jgi:hypothetical protein
LRPDPGVGDWINVGGATLSVVVSAVVVHASAWWRGGSDGVQDLGRDAFSRPHLGT